MNRIRIGLPRDFLKGLSCLEMENCRPTPKGLIIVYDCTIVNIVESRRLFIPVTVELTREEREAVREICFLKQVLRKGFIVTIPVDDSEIVLCCNDVFCIAYRVGQGEHAKVYSEIVA